MAGAITDFTGITADVLRERASPDLETSNLVKGPLSSFAADLASRLRAKIEKGNVTLSDLHSIPKLDTPEKVMDLAGRHSGQQGSRQESVFDRLRKDLEKMKAAANAKKRAEKEVSSLEDELSRLRGGKGEERRREPQPESGSAAEKSSGAEQQGGRRRLAAGGQLPGAMAGNGGGEEKPAAASASPGTEAAEGQVRDAAEAGKAPVPEDGRVKEGAAPEKDTAAGADAPAEGAEGDVPEGRRVILSGRELAEMESEIGRRLMSLKEEAERDREELQKRIREADSGKDVTPEERSLMKRLARARSRLRNSEISLEAASAIATGTAEQAKAELHGTLMRREIEKEKKCSEFFRSEVEARAEQLRKDVSTARSMGLSPRLFSCTDQRAQVEYAMKRFEAPGFSLRGKSAEPPAESNVFLAYLRLVGGNRELARIFRSLGRKVGFDSRSASELADGDPTGRDSGRADYTRRDRLGGITLGGSIQRALPVELARLSIPETEILFEQSWLEGRLLSFDFDGTCRTFESSSSQRLGERLSRGDMRGPVIVLVDTSSSMRGFPEDAAKACAMTMALRCRQENRACHIIKFSSVISEFRMRKGGSNADLAAFLGKSFRGGTDIDSGLMAAVRILESDPEFIKADLICCTDGWFRVGKDVQQKMSMLRKRRMVRFYELITGIQIGNDKQNFDEVYCINFRRMETQRNKVQPLTMMGAGGFGVRPGAGMR